MENLRPELWQLRYLSLIGSKSWFLHIIVVTLVFAAVRNQGYFPTTWYFLVVSASLVMAFMCRYASALNEARDSIRILWFGAAHTFGCAFVGILWGIGALYTAQMSFEVALFYSLALGGTTLGAISTQSPVIRSSLTSIWTSVSLLALAHWLYSPQPFGTYTAGLMILFGLTVSIFSNRINGFLNENHQLSGRLKQQIKELKQTSKQLEAAREVAAKSDAAKSRFLAHASHDLRQPLHAIGLINNNMMQESLSPPAKDSAEQIAKMVSYMSELFGALLNFSALELGKVRPQNSRFCLNTLLQDVINRNAVTAKLADCELMAMPCSYWVETDRSLLLNILQNLVSNAIKYAPGTPILLAYEGGGDTLSVSVSDQGAGIPASETSAVFGEYYRLKLPKSNVVEGLGLGLALVQRFSNIMGLSCALVSSPDTGTCVKIGDIKTVGRQTTADRETLYGHVRLVNLKVHIVENDLKILNATTELLTRWGCQVSGSQQIPNEKTGMDFLITDYVLDQISSGADCIKQVRELEGRQIPAIVITGLLNTDLAGGEMDALIGLLEKPAPAQKIRSLILSLLTKEKSLSQPASL